MQLQLIQGQFAPQDALNILTEMIRVKISYHEQKIADGAMEEDIHMRERRISELQNELHEVRRQLKQSNSLVSLDAAVDLH
jgi:vacuolar-type H+-ATPase subunit I/STV1